MGKFNCTKPTKEKVTKRGRPFGTVKSTLTKTHSGNQSRLTAFLSGPESSSNPAVLLVDSSSVNSSATTETPSDTNSPNEKELSLEPSANPAITIDLTANLLNTESDRCEVDETDSSNEENTTPNVDEQIMNDFEDDIASGIENEEILDEFDDDILSRVEQEAGSIKESSVVDRYLKSIQERIKDDKKGSQRRSAPPKEYQNGTFWVQRKNAAFILRDQLELNPDQLYQPRVFLWFPHHLSSNLKCPKCTVPTTFYVKEWNTNPRARRITDLNE